MHFDAVPFAARPAPETQVVTQLTHALRAQLTVAGVTNATGLAANGTASKCITSPRVR